MAPTRKHLHTNFKMPPVDPTATRPAEKSAQQTHCYTITINLAVTSWQRMTQQCCCKPGVRPRWFFRWWLTLSNLQKLENPPVNTFQWISGPSELSFTTVHSSTILTLIRTTIYNNSSRHYLQFLAQNVLVNWPLTPTLMIDGDWWT